MKVKLWQFDIRLTEEAKTVEEISNGFGISRTVDQLVEFKAQKWVPLSVAQTAVNHLTIANRALANELIKSGAPKGGQKVRELIEKGKAASKNSKETNRGEK